MLKIYYCGNEGAREEIWDVSMIKRGQDNVEELTQNKVEAIHRTTITMPRRTKNLRHLRHNVINLNLNLLVALCCNLISSIHSFGVFARGNRE
jgi:hypothetical protein